MRFLTVLRDLIGVLAIFATGYGMLIIGHGAGF